MAFVSQILWISSLEKNSETTDKYFTLILHSRISVILVVMLFVDWMTRWCHLTEHSLFRKGFQGDQISSKIFVSLGKDILMNFCQFLQPTLREKCPYSLFGVFLVTTFSRSDLIRRDTRYLSVFSQNAGKYGPEKLQIQTLSRNWKKFTADDTINKIYEILWKSLSRKIINFNKNLE